MKIHEYQAKEFFAAAGIPVPSGRVVTSPEDARKAADEIGKPVVVKAQVLVGGRGKAGGVKLAKNPGEAKDRAQEILGMDIKGETVEKVLVTEAVDIAKEIYVGIILDRSSQKPLIMSSSEGGVEIEVVAKEKPEAIHRLTIDPLVGMMGFQARDIAMKLNPDFKVARQIATIIEKLYTVYTHTDASLAENLLVIQPFGLYLAWISVAIVANSFHFLDYRGWIGLTATGAALATVMMAVAVALGVWGLVRRHIWSFPLVVGWALWGIGQRWPEPALIHRAAFALAALSVLVVLASLAGGTRGGAPYRSE